MAGICLLLSRFLSLKLLSMKKLIKKYENKLLLVQSDILDGKCPNLEMQFYKNGEQSVLIEIINDLKNISESPICPHCHKYKKMQGNGIMHQLCECGQTAP